MSSRRRSPPGQKGILAGVAVAKVARDHRHTADIGDAHVLVGLASHAHEAGADRAASLANAQVQVLLGVQLCLSRFRRHMTLPLLSL